MEEDFLELLSLKEKEFNKEFNEKEFKTLYDFYILGKQNEAKRMQNILFKNK